MSRQLTIEGRYVRGGLTMHPKKDMKTQLPKKNDDGTPVLENYIGVAVPKKVNVGGVLVDNPKVGEYWAAFEAESKDNFGYLYANANNANSHPRFANKWQDGDGVDSNGKSVAATPGYAGHWIINCATQLKAPACYIRNGDGTLQQLAEPEKIIKKGFYVAVAVTITGNGVEKDNAQAVPGLYVTPESVLYVAPGEEIFVGVDPNAAFAGIAGSAPPAGAVTAGLSAPPQPAATGAPPLPGSAPPQPGNGPGAAPGPVAASSAPASPGGPPMPPMPGAGAPPIPPAPAAGPQYIMQPSAMGATREQMHGINWTDEAMVAAGHMVIVP
jgi:hypothetical protein